LGVQVPPPLLGRPRSSSTLGLASTKNRPFGPFRSSGLRPSVAVMAVASTNLDLLGWFDEGERACVSLPEAKAAFCLACGAVHIDGVRIDVDRRIALDAT